MINLISPFRFVNLLQYSLAKATRPSIILPSTSLIAPRHTLSLHLHPFQATFQMSTSYLPAGWTSERLRDATPADFASLSPEVIIPSYQVNEDRIGRPSPSPPHLLLAGETWRAANKAAGIRARKPKYQ